VAASDWSSTSLFLVAAGRVAVQVRLLVLEYCVKYLVEYSNGTGCT